ncbi:MAG: hypothetical protein WA705_11460 [Candidatus Ozemobacteraceae bacterium]
MKNLRNSWSFRFRAILVLALFAGAVQCAGVDFQTFESTITRIQGARDISGKITLSNAEISTQLQDLAKIGNITVDGRVLSTDFEWVSTAWLEICQMKNDSQRKSAVDAFFDCMDGLSRAYRAPRFESSLTSEIIRNSLRSSMKATRPLDESILAKGYGVTIPEVCRGSFVEGIEGEVSALRVISAPLGFGSSFGSSNRYTGSGSSGSRGTPGVTYGGRVTQSGSSRGTTTSTKNSTRYSTGGTSSPNQPFVTPTDTGFQGGRSTQVVQVSPTGPTNTRPVTYPGGNYPTPTTPSHPVSRPTNVSYPQSPLPASVVVNNGLEGVGLALFIIIIFAMVTSFFGVLYYIFGTVKKNFEPAPVTVVIEKALSIAEEHIEIPTLHAEAVKLARQGKYDHAIRLLTVGSMLLLDERRVLNYHNSVTNGEYLRNLLESEHEELQSLWSAPLKLFDGLIYGFRIPGWDEFAVFETLYLKLRDMKGV